MNFFGNSVFIMGNRKIISSSSECGVGEKRTFDETKTEKIVDIDSISIDSVSADVTVMVKNTPDITVHFSGWVSNMSGNVKFDTSVVERELQVKLYITGNMITGNLKINITVPSEMIFKSFTFNSKSADLEILDKLYAKRISINTMSGDVTGEMQFEDVFAKTMSGDIDIVAFAKDYTSMKLLTMSGDIDIKLNNFGKVMFRTKTMTGDIRNRFEQNNDGCTADIELSTMSGDIKIK